MAVEEIKNEVVGNYLSREATFVLTTLTSTTQNFTLPNVHNIQYIKSFAALDSGNNYASDGADLTFSGNVLTVADGTGYDHDAMTTLVVTVICQRRV